MDAEKAYRYDSQPHLDDLHLAATHPHHKQVLPDVKGLYCDECRAIDQQFVYFVVYRDILVEIALDLPAAEAQLRSFSFERLLLWYHYQFFGVVGFYYWETGRPDKAAHCYDLLRHLDPQHKMTQRLKAKVQPSWWQRLLGGRWAIAAAARQLAAMGGAR